MRTIRSMLFVALSVVLGCGGDDGSTTPESGEHENVIPQVVPATDPYTDLVESFDLEMSTGHRIQGMIRRPDTTVHSGLRFPVVIVIPGGINPGRTEAESPDAGLLAQAGLVVVCYNAEGRVSDRPGDVASEGEENYNGTVNQDNLATIVQYTMGLPYVNADNVGVASFSFGVTVVAGCLSRHPELGVKYFVDGEGPSRSFVTCHEPRSLDDDTANDKHETVFDVLGHYSTARDTSQANREFWEEREAVRFIGAYRGRYLRLQAYWDHIQPPLSEADYDDFEQPPIWWHNKHTTEIVEAALDGGVPWVRVNLDEQGNSLNVTYDFENRPVFIPGVLKEAETPWYARAISAMARLEADQPFE